MTEKRFELSMNGDEVAQYEIIDHNQEILTVYNNLGNVYFSSAMKICELLNNIAEENEQLKKELKRCKDWLNSDENDYQLTLSFIKSKGYSLKDVLEYEKELKMND